MKEFLPIPAAKYGDFFEIMSKFTPTSKKLVEKIEDLMDKGEKLFKEIVAYFGEPNSSSLDEFFGELFRFGVSFEKTKGEIQKKRELEIRQRQRQEQQERAKQQQQTKMPMGRLEQAIADLTSGNAYTGRPNQASKSSSRRDSPALVHSSPQSSRSTSRGADQGEVSLTPRQQITIPRHQATGTPRQAPGTPRQHHIPVTPRTPRGVTPPQTATVQKDQLAAALAFLKK